MNCMITVVNKHAHKATEQDIYVGRGSDLGNPYTGTKPLESTKAMFQAKSREESIELYKSWIQEKIRVKDKAVCKALNEIYLRSVRGPVNLVCFCKPKACHGDVIRAIVMEKLEQRFPLL
jgi:hypothetical protein